MKGKSGEDSLRGNGKRKRWSAADKLRIVLAGMEPGVEIADLCRREGLAPPQYYQWKRQLLGAADRIFEKKATKPTAREQRLASELTRAKDVIAEITAECQKGPPIFCWHEKRFQVIGCEGWAGTRRRQGGPMARLAMRRSRRRR